MKIMRKIMRNDRGSSSIEIAIGVLLFMIVLMFAVDIMRISLGFAVISQATTEVARIASVQGGFQRQKPAHFPDSYVSIDDMQKILDNKMSKANVSSNNYNITIKPSGKGASGGFGSGGTRSTGNIDYKQEFEVIGSIDYEWTIIQSVLRKNFQHTLTSARVGMSEWKFDYGDWNGEGFDSDDY